MYLSILPPGKTTGQTVMSVEKKTMKPNDEALRREVFNEAKKLRLMSARELAAVRDAVLTKKKMLPGTRGPNAPGTAAPGAAGSSGSGAAGSGL